MLEPVDGQDDNDDTTDSDAVIAIAMHSNDGNLIVDELCAGILRVFCTEQLNKQVTTDDHKETQGQHSLSG